MKRKGSRGVEYLFAEVEITGGAHVFCEGIGYDIDGALVARRDLLCFECPADVVVFEGNVT